MLVGVFVFMLFGGVVWFFANLISEGKRYQKQQIRIQSSASYVPPHLPRLVSGFTTEQMHDLLEESGYMEPLAAEWITPLINQSEVERWGLNKLILEIRGAGQRLNKDQVKSLGLRGNTKIGLKYLDSLTWKGLRDPKWIDEFLYQLIRSKNDHNYLLQKQFLKEYREKDGW